jgi:hypothetical protein
MIVAGLLLILVAAALLVLGLAVSSTVLLVVSIAASLVAAVALLAGTRLVAARGGEGLAGLVDPLVSVGDSQSRGGARGAPPTRVAGRSEALVVVGGQHYHLPGCPDPVDGMVERRPLSEAEEMGLTPCPVCEPDAVIFVDAGRA